MMKAALVRTRIGSFLFNARDRISIHRLVGEKPQEVEAAVNDYLARIFLERLCLPGKTFIDVGAHIGSVLAGVGRNSRPGRIIAIEAIPEKAQVLRRRFPHVEIHSCALGESDGTVQFFIDVDQSGYSSIDRAAASTHGSAREIVVPLRRLDDIVASDDVDMMKIDVEGAELGVLRGAERLIANSRPTIMFESGPRTMGDYTKPALHDWFGSRGYAIHVPNRLPETDAGLSVEGFEEAHGYPRRTTNYFAVPQERREAVRTRARTILKL